MSGNGNPSVSGILSSSQVEAMRQAASSLQQDVVAHDYTKAATDAAQYYSLQTPSRGYASLALQMVNDTGDGHVANREIAQAVGPANYTPDFRYQLINGLVQIDIQAVQGNREPDGTALAPSLAQDASEHLQVFSDLNIPLSAWGGTGFVALGQDFTNGQASAVELRDITPPAFDTLPKDTVVDALNRLRGCLETPSA